MSVKKIYKPKNFFFFFHKKYDTGTWTIVFASITLTMYAAIFFFALAYSFPKCFCEDPYPHFNVLPLKFVVTYFSFLFMLLSAIISCILAIYGTFKARLKLLYCFLVAEFMTALVVFVFSIVLIQWLAKMDQYLLFSNETYMDITKLILKEDIANQVSSVMNTVGKLMETLVDKVAKPPVTSATGGTEINLNSLMDALLNDYVLGLLGGLKLIMKCGTVMICIGLNAIFICGFLTSLSHYLRLKNGTASPYHSSIPGCLINSAVMTNSARSTATESLNDDWSTSASNNYKSTPRNFVYSNVSEAPNNNNGYHHSSHHQHTTSRSTTNKSRKSRSNYRSGSNESLRSTEYSRRAHKNTSASVIPNGTSTQRGSKQQRQNLSVVGQFPPDRFL